MENGGGGEKTKNGEDGGGGTIVVADNYLDGKFVPPKSGEYMDVVSPLDSSLVGIVALSDADDVDAAVEAAMRAFPKWSAMTWKARASVVLKFHSLLRDDGDELAELIVRENGKNLTEAKAEVAKGLETAEYAAAAANSGGGTGAIARVSGGNVYCHDYRKPLGVVASVVPFNFPFMVPFWTLPIALVSGNCLVLKPSEKVPLTVHMVCERYARRAGFPDGVLQVVNGTRKAVEALIDHPRIRALTFVGSSPVADAVSTRCRNTKSGVRKRCIALGGAKNHLCALPDCDSETASSDIAVSFAGCAGQRCMAASVLLLVGSGDSGNDEEGDGERRKLDDLLDAVVDKASKIQPGNGPGEMGPVIDGASHAKILGYLDDVESNCPGAKILLDGRSWCKKEDKGKSEGKGGYWIGPTVILHTNPQDRAMREEIFGPVLSVYRCESWTEAIEIENSSPFGNAAAVYTTSGGSANWFTDRFKAAMLGVNVGIPVPREPFSFGGLAGTRSKYGDGGGADITGDGAVEFFTDRIKITTRYPAPRCAPPPQQHVGATASAAAASAEPAAPANSTKRKADEMDHANFAGSM